MKAFAIGLIASIIVPVAASAQNMDASPMMQSAIIQGATNSNIIRGMYDGGAHVGTSGIYVGRPGSRGARNIGAAGPARPLAGQLGGQVGGPIAVFDRPASPAAANIAMPYRPTPALRRAAQQGYVTRAARTAPEAARQMEQQFARVDYAKAYRSLIGGTGLRENDVADAVAAYTSLGWMIANNSLGDPNPRAIQSVRAQVAQSLSTNPQFDDPATRGALAEEMKLLFVTLHAGWQSAQKEGNLRPFSDSVAAMFAKQTGNDLRALRLTERGLVRG